uniref:E3 ubiquitin-protein ligase TRIM39-like isoform X2 n=1 Tax=Geotrypetes seraphini TaxID=260995 RepID=A0A6P8RLS7_GEOSA|nr:E3 ubiquitin-protein ligase TRIM39-like isoform X2 [Geotrypetes seraphini]
MAAANPLESLREEASCSICLDYFTDPVTTDCGHNFCRSCITQAWEGRDPDSPCPQCKKRSRNRNLRSNRQLANVIEIARKLSQACERPKEENRCEKHEEELMLFCELDQRAICGVCGRSRDHRSHPVIPMEEAEQDYKEKFKMHLESLRKHGEALLKFKSAEEKKAEELRSEAQIKRQKVESEFEELLQFLDKEKQFLLSKLEEEEKQILQRIGENVSQLQEQSSSLTQLISEIEKKSQQPAAELLKDVKDTLRRCQKMKFPQPEVVSTDLKTGFKLSYCQQLKKLVTNIGVDVTLDPETAHPKLIVSEDRKSVRRGDTKQNPLDNLERFDTELCVLGCEGFTLGRHYWEVEVGDDPSCILGVCKDSVGRKGKFKPSYGAGYWTVLCGGQRFWALTSPEIYVPPREIPQTVGILLDCEAGKVSFYDAENKSHFYTFTDTFAGKLRPFLCNQSEFPLRICPVPALK